MPPLRDLVLHSEVTLRALVRRRLTMTVLVLMPLALYMASHDAIGQSVRALLFGISWAVSTVAFFAATAATQIEPRLRVAGRSTAFLVLARLIALLVTAFTLALSFWLVVSLDQPLQSPSGALVDFATTAVVAVAVGTAVGSLLETEMEGTLVLFFLAGLQAVVGPDDRFSQLLPFWSSRELATYAVDGPGLGSLGAGLLHATAVCAVCVALVAVNSRRRRGVTPAAGLP